MAKSRDWSLRIGLAVAFAVPAGCMVNSRASAPVVLPEEMSGYETGDMLATTVTTLFVALVVYLVRRYGFLDNAKGQRGWDAFVLFLLAAVAGNIVARFVPIPGL